MLNPQQPNGYCGSQITNVPGLIPDRDLMMAPFSFALFRLNTLPLSVYIASHYFHTANQILLKADVTDVS